MAPEAGVAPTQELILEALRKHGPMEVDQIAQATGKGQYNIRDRLRWMLKDGKVVRIATGLYATPKQAEVYERVVQQTHE